MGPCASANDVADKPMIHTCACGSVELHSVEAHPRLLLECCCRDCDIRIEWVIANGSKGNMITPKGPTLNAISVNRFTQIKGKENLKLYKMKEDSIHCMFICDKCKDCVAIQHGFLSPNIFVAPADVSTIKATKPIIHEDA